MWAGSRRRYVPGFPIRLANGINPALEMKGNDSPQNKVKRNVSNERITAINAAGGVGRRGWDVAFKPGMSRTFTRSTPGREWRRIDLGATNF